MKNKTMQYLKKLQVFVKEISKLSKDPLDGDQTEILSKMFNIELDFQNGNITSKEYEEKYRNINMEIL